MDSKTKQIIRTKNSESFIIFFIIVLILTISCSKKNRMIEKESDVINIYQQIIPATRFVGKIGYEWEEWFKEGWFFELFALIPQDFQDQYEDYGAFLGLYGFDTNSSTYVYYIGMLLPENTTVPTGYEHIDFPASTLGVGWAYGEATTVHNMYDVVLTALKDESYEIIIDEKGIMWCIERCAYPRYTDPDHKGNIILDFCYFVK